MDYDRRLHGLTLLHGTGQHKSHEKAVDPLTEISVIHSEQERRKQGRNEVGT